MSSRVIDAVLKLRDEFTGPMKKSLSLMTEASKDGAKARKSIAKTGEAISGLGTKLTAGITLPLAGVATASVSSFGEVDKSMRLVEATMGEAAWATGDLEGEMKKAAASSVFGMQDAADASLNFARQGFNAQEAAAMLSPAMSLAAGTATDLADVTGGLGNSMKIFGLQFDDAAWAADTLAKAQASANTTTQDLFDSISIAGPVAKSVGWEMDELATVTAALGNAGISGSEGANAIKTGLARLASPAKQGAEWMEKLGINVFDESGQMLNAVDVQKQLHDSFAGLSQQEQLSAASAIFGKEQMSKWLSLINTAPESFQGLQTEIANSKDSAENMADSLMNGVGGSIEKLKSTWDVAKYDIGQTIGEVVQPFIDKVTEVINWFTSLDEEGRKQIIRMAGIAAAVGPVLLVFGKMVTNVSKLLGVFAKIKQAAGLLKAGWLALNAPAAIVVGALAALVVAGVLIYKNWDKIKAKAQEVGQTIMQKFGGPISKLVAQFKSFVSAARTTFTGIWNTIQQNMQKASQTLGPVISGIIQNIKGVIETIVPVILNVGTSILANVQQLITNIGPVIQGIINFLTPILTFIVGTFWSGISGVISTLGPTISNLVTDIGGYINGIMDVLNGIITFITGVFTGDWGKAWQGIKDVFSGIIEQITSLINGVKDAVGGVVEEAKGFAKGVGNFVTSHLPGHAAGTVYWRGGPTRVNERGGEILDLPQGTRIIPNDVSRSMSSSVNIPKLADQIIVREDADIDRIGDMLVRRLQGASGAMGVA